MNNYIPKQSKQTWILDELRELDVPITLVRRRFGRIDDDFCKRLLEEICTFPDPMIFSLGEKEILFNEDAASEILESLDQRHDGIFSSFYCSKFPLGLSKEESDLETNNFNIISSQRGLRLSRLENLTSSSIFLRDRSSNFLEIEKYLVFNGDFQIGPNGEGTLRPTTYIPNLRKIELDITYICNLTCSGCSRSSAQAPSNMHMPIEVIQNFLSETETKGIRWESLHILGGEPTLHPDFVEIVLTLDEWFQRHSPETDLKVITNGVSKLTKSNIEKIPERWHYDNSFKIDFQKATSHFEPFNLAPIDLEEWKEQDFRKGCYITQDSGIGLTPYGYFHCAIAGGMERIMNLGHGLESIPDHPWEMLEMMEDYCKNCGHFLSDTFVERVDRDDLIFVLLFLKLIERIPHIFNGGRDREAVGTYDVGAFLGLHHDHVICARRQRRFSDPRRPIYKYSRRLHCRPCLNLHFSLPPASETAVRAAHRAGRLGQRAQPRCRYCLDRKRRR